MSDSQKTAIVTPWGFRQLDPLPTPAELDAFYGGGAYEKAVVAGKSDPPLRRQLEGNAAEDEWLERCLYSDVLYMVAEYNDLDLAGDVPLLVDVGSGRLCSFAHYAHENGFDVVAVDPMVETDVVGRSGIVKVNGDYMQIPDVQATAITALNVMNHVLDPSGLMRAVVDHLLPGGVAVILVPNDFSDLQRAVCRGEYWVARPDHVSYFTIDSAVNFIESFGLDVVDMISQYPMELFLLQGTDYLSDPAVGAWCHEQVRQMEMAMSANLRRRIGRAWADAGVGRDVLVCARKPVKR